MDWTTILPSTTEVATLATSLGLTADNLLAFLGFFAAIVAIVIVFSIPTGGIKWLGNKVLSLFTFGK